jgi:hypothetical protein
MMPTKNFDRYTNEVARQREQVRESAKKSAKKTYVAPKAETVQVQPIKPAQPIAREKPDWVNVLVENVKGNGGTLTMFPCDLAPLLGLSSGTGMAAILGVLETERHSLFAAGVRYFSYGRAGNHRNHSAIAFRMLSLDSQK